MMELDKVLQQYTFQDRSLHTIPFGSGLINHTYKITGQGNEYILQQINPNVFEDPMHIAANIDRIAKYLDQYAPEYFFVKPVTANNGASSVEVDGLVYRMFPFVRGSHSKDTLENQNQAFEAAVQFGRFTKLTSGFDATQLHITLPHFHDLSYRYRSFETALQNGNKERIAAAKEWIDFIRSHNRIVKEFETIRTDPAFRIRVTHHDTKISNVLFDKNDKGICVIDLDTVMPGYFISDVGDMMRTYLSPVSEEEKDFSKIGIRDEVYHSIVNGYRSEMGTVLTVEEQSRFFYAGAFMIYMQALRFLTDHISDDVYYGAAYPGQNLKRASNQIVLLERFMEKKEQYRSV